MTQQAFWSKFRVAREIPRESKPPCSVVVIVIVVSNLEQTAFKRFFYECCCCWLHRPFAGQNSGSSKRDSLFTSTLPLSFFSSICSSFLSLFLGYLYAFSVLPFPFLCRSARDCETSFSDTIPYRRDYLFTRLLFDRSTLLFLLCCSF